MSLFQLRSIYMGYNAQDGGAHLFNYYKSGTAGIDQLDIDPSNTSKPLYYINAVAVIGYTASLK